MLNQPAIKKTNKIPSTLNYGKYGLLFVTPFFVTFLIFQLYSIFFTFNIALSDAQGWDKILNNSFVGLANFQALFDSSNQLSINFWTAFQNTVIIWSINFLPQIAMALILGNWFTDARMNLRFQGGFKVLIFMPNTITAATIAVLFYSFFNYPISPVNTLLQQLGILNTPFEFYRSATASRGIISFIQWWMWYGSTMIILIAGILGINPVLFEAATVDGCTSRQIFTKITLPLLKPILLYNMVTSLIGGLQIFDIPFLLTQGNPNNTTNTVARFIYLQAFSGTRNFNYASAASVVLFGIIVIASAILFFVMTDREPKAKKGAK